MYPTELPKKLNRTKDNQNNYESQGMYHSTYFLLNSDSTFVYYNVFEVGFDLTMGKYTKEENTISFNWDSLKTLQAVVDTSIYKKYFQYGIPRPLKIVNEQYKLQNGSLNYINK